MAQQWEYDSIKNDGYLLMENLNEKGKEGWEAISILYTTGMRGGYTVLMKRPIESVGIQRKPLEKEQK